jgi:D-glycero-D-manno-heptose 1,7-bisphosphate phosphatase
MKPAAFFDRDGVLNLDKHFVHKIEDFEWLPGAVAAIGLLNHLDYYVFVVSNQSGVARGFYRAAEVEAVHGFMRQELARQGARIDAFYYCPHHPDIDGPCICRKPQPGMLLQAMTDYPVDKYRSFLVGYKPTDVEAARNAGVRGYLFSGGDLLAEIKRILGHEDCV